jgi:hypothetical protein
MKNNLTILGLALSLFIPSVGAQDNPRKPGPEEKKLEVWTGQWETEGQYVATVFGPAEKGTSKLSARMILDGFCLEETGTTKAPSLSTKYIALTTYNPKTKQYVSYYCDTTGYAEAEAITVQGNIWTYLWNEDAKGKTYKCRSVVTVSKDGKSWTNKWEYSEDGEKWLLRMEGKGKKLREVR